MTQMVNVDKFAVPYAIDFVNGEARVFHILEGRPRSKETLCPICRGRVSFVSETSTRSAHFRHHDRSECDKQAGLLRNTIHNDVVNAAMAMLNGRLVAADICKGQCDLKLPTGAAEAERSVILGGQTYRPDVTVVPADGERACTLELEVVWSHKPTANRLEIAAQHGRAIGVLDASKIERDYYRMRWANQAFDIPEAIKDYIARERFSILTTESLRRSISGLISRQYTKATVAPEHRQWAQGPAHHAPSRRTGRPPAPMVRVCSYEGCGSTHAPYGFGWPGLNRDKPEDLRGHVFTCAHHRAWGESLIRNARAMRAALARGKENKE